MILFSLLLNVLRNAFPGRQLHCKLINDLHFQSIIFHRLLLSSQRFIKSIEHHYASVAFFKQLNCMKEAQDKIMEREKNRQLELLEKVRNSSKMEELREKNKKLFNN